ncbi:OLC1v1006905C1 [Oldenlandia corymbosa var. corymbosa]|uniref:OLC1v1006905C1 n=1 Tax=Oldenlandia corymbosa var. corymbosa TaxID=529605 RepID=A0AAV1DLG5_OLDCO|nr:OLC1v1006905C1 [Oldenlandia corymbosa var. corymbosa]
MDTEMSDTSRITHENENPTTKRVKNRDQIPEITENDHPSSEQSDPPIATTSNPMFSTLSQLTSPAVEGIPSFKDRLLQGQSSHFSNGYHMMNVTVEEGDVTYGDEDGVPSTNFSKRVKTHMKIVMTYSIVVKPLSRDFRWNRLHKRLKGLWKIKGELKPMDTIEGYHFFRLTTEEDYYFILLNGPWSLDDHYILVLPWTKQFSTKDDNISAVAIWICILDLPIEYFHEDLLRSVAKPIGRYLKDDKNTITVERGQFARLAVELDLTKPLIGKTKVDEKFYNIEYEDLQQICYTCGRYGHHKEVCPKKPNGNSNLTTGETPSTTPVLPQPSGNGSNMGPKDCNGITYPQINNIQILETPQRTPTIWEWSHAVKKGRRYQSNQGSPFRKSLRTSIFTAKYANTVSNSVQCSRGFSHLGKQLTTFWARHGLMCPVGRHLLRWDAGISGKYRTKKYLPIIIPILEVWPTISWLQQKKWKESSTEKPKSSKHDHGQPNMETTTMTLDGAICSA